MLLKKRFEKVWREVQRQEYAGKCEPAKSNRREALKNREAKRDVSFP
jgi:hypothetical protein